MESILKHLVELTGHRDHDLLDISIMSALHDLVGVQQARVLEIFKVHGQPHLHTRVHIEDGQFLPCDEHADGDSDIALSTYPALAACIEQRSDSTEQINADGSHVLWLPIWLNDRLSSCLEIKTATALGTEARLTMDGMLRVYYNFQNLLDYSERDSLTGLLNRKTFDENFSRLVTAANQCQSPAQANGERRGSSEHHEHREHWLAVIDIDHFKRVNDRFGHLYGDEVLLLVSNLLRNSFRAQDRIFRFGGEEFVVLLRAATLTDARSIFTRFRTNVEHYDFPQVGQITVSIGFAGLSQQTPVVILGHADQALYHAKTHGRNQVSHYEELVSKGLLHAEVTHDDVEFF